MTQRIKITRIVLADFEGKVICGEVQPKEFFAKKDLLGSIRIESHEPVIVLHDRHNGYGNRLYFYAGKECLLWMAAPMVTKPGQSIEIPPTVVSATK